MRKYTFDGDEGESAKEVLPTRAPAGTHGLGPVQPGAQEPPNQGPCARTAAPDVVLYSPDPHDAVYITLWLVGSIARSVRLPVVQRCCQLAPPVTSVVFPITRLCHSVER